MAVGGKIVATDYNSMQTSISNLLGVGSGDSGYAQSVLSSQVSTSSKISVTQWNNLQTDILKTRQHQTGIAETLTTASTSTLITEADRAAYAAMIALANTNRLNTPPSSQATRSNISIGTVTVAWNGTITHSITMTFGSADLIRNYFNAGGYFDITASRSGGNAGLKNTSWTTMLTNMGTITLGRTTTTRTGTGTAYAIGYTSLTGSDQLIFQKLTETSTYSPNQYDIYARITGSALILTIQFADLATYTNTTTYGGGYGPYGVDENIDGTLTSTVQTYRASGTNVATPAPTISASITNGSVA